MSSKQDGLGLVGALTVPERRPELELAIQNPDS